MGPAQTGKSAAASRGRRGGGDFNFHDADQGRDGAAWMHACPPHFELLPMHTVNGQRGPATHESAELQRLGVFVSLSGTARSARTP
jgi:hypothetical protein